MKLVRFYLSCLRRKRESRESVKTENTFVNLHSQKGNNIQGLSTHPVAGSDNHSRQSDEKTEKTSTTIDRNALSEYLTLT